MKVIQQIIALSIFLASPLGAMDMAKRPSSETITTILREPSSLHVGLPALAGLAGFGTFFGGIQAFNSNKRSDQLFWGLVSGVSAIVTPSILDYAKTLDMNKNIVTGAAIGGCLLGVAASWYKTGYLAKSIVGLVKAAKPKVKLIQENVTAYSYNCFLIEPSSQIYDATKVRLVIPKCIDTFYNLKCASLSTDHEYVCASYSASDEQSPQSFVKIFKIYNQNTLDPKEVCTLPLENLKLGLLEGEILLKKINSQNYKLYVLRKEIIHFQPDMKKEITEYSVLVNSDGTLTCGTPEEKNNLLVEVEELLKEFRAIRIRFYNKIGSKLGLS